MMHVFSSFEEGTEKVYLKFVIHLGHCKNNRLKSYGNYRIIILCIFKKLIFQLL